MATIESVKKQTLDLMHTIQDISAATSVLNWDQETYMPSGASAMRAEQISTLSTLAHQLLTGDKAKSLASEILSNKAETSKDRLDASLELKKANARVQGINYLSKKF